MNEYNYKAVKTIVGNHTYDSRLEGSVAALLTSYHIEFLPHQKYYLFDREGKNFSYELDFYFPKPQKFLGTGWIDGIEVKGILKKHDFLRRDALHYKMGIDVFIATEPIIKCWIYTGLYKNKPQKWVDLDSLMIKKESDII